jgi:uncharacterized membrane protein HdeD (DUF308 family)
MAITPSDDVRQIRAAFAETISRHWVFFLCEGIVLAILGVLAIFVPVVASLAATIFFGWLLLLSGIVGMITTFRAQHAPGFWWSLLSAMLGIAAGVYLIAWPTMGVFSLTAVLIAFLFIEGFLSILYALEHRRGVSGRWGWMLASGILDLVLGMLLIAGLPSSATWALGLLLGINMIFGGWALIVMALAARGQPAHPVAA